jgi:putative DNA methylase
LSYANRLPIAWVALFDALQAAGFYAAGYEIVTSENELDYSKSGRRSCTLDVILDLVQTPLLATRQHKPTRRFSTPEERYCDTIGKAALAIGSLEDGWERTFTEALRAEPFLGR